MRYKVLWAMTPVPAATVWRCSVAAQNAQLTVNNVAIESQQQHYQRRVENITLNLNDVTTGNQTLTITQDTSKAQTAIKDSGECL